MFTDVVNVAALAEWRRGGVERRSSAGEHFLSYTRRTADLCG